MTHRKIEFLFQAPGLIEAVVFGPGERRRGLLTDGYRDCGIPDLMLDLHPDTGKPYSFMSMNFDRSYPAIIWGLRFLMEKERFDVPSAGLRHVTLAEAFSWAYTHYILEDEFPRVLPPPADASLTRQVLAHSLAAV